ncbi:MAG: nicotinate (nicotinamide) nucleotide adenylyltransferase [Chloroflexia bacterium]|nr:nicotinate (nicotinamide) nucleotide adenylyltransferase [Chloroflexia bacterium]
MKTMRTGILGGSFDPVHHGHLILARAAREELGLDRVIFIPAHVSPHKTETKPASGEDRLAMVRLAIAGEHGFETSDIELKRPPPSYTVETLRQLQAAHPDEELVLLVGADNVAKFDTWREPDDIRRIAKIAVLNRAGGTSPSDWPVVRRLVDISSTDIRSRVAAGRCIRYLTPDTVCDYIATHGLYRNA